MTDQDATAPEGDTPEWAALQFWRALVDDGEERSLMGGYWLPQWSMRFDRDAILSDFARLDRPALRGRLQGAEDPRVRYAAIIEGAETADHELLWTTEVSRYFTLVWEPTLKFWAVAHYGPEWIEPQELPV